MAKDPSPIVEDVATARRSVRSWISSLSTKYSSTSTLVSSPSSPRASLTTIREITSKARSPEVHGSSTTYQIGNRHFYVPLVNVTELKAHLSLLHAFKEIRQRLAETPDSVLPKEVAAKGIEDRWMYMVDLAVERCVQSFVLHIPTDS